MKQNDLAGKPKVSVIMGIYNCEKTLKEAVDSICLQTYSNWELIIWDDGSTDGTYELPGNMLKKTVTELSCFMENKTAGCPMR